MLAQEKREQYNETNSDLDNKIKKECSGLRKIIIILFFYYNFALLLCNAFVYFFWYNVVKNYETLHLQILLV